MARGLTIAVVLLLAGCAEPGPPTLADESVVGGLPAAVWPDDPSVITDVSCPDLDPALIAQTTTCAARIHGDPITIDVVIDETGLSTSTVRETLFDVGAAASQITERLETDLGVASAGLVVTCETPVLVARTDNTVECVAERGGDEIGFDVRLVDADGRWSLAYRE